LWVSKMMDYEDRIRGLMQSYCSLLYLGTGNHKLAVRKCIDIATDFSMDVYAYNIGEGLRRPGREKPKDANIDPIEMLNRIVNTKFEPLTGKRKLFLLEHFDLLLENRDPFLLTRLRLIADSTCHASSTILTGRTGFQVPEIINDIPRISAASLSSDDIGEIVNSCQKDLPPGEKERLVEGLSGLTALQCEDLLALSLATRNSLDWRFLRKERALLLSKRAGKFIQLCEPEVDLESVGGLDHLKEWLMKRGRHFSGKVPQGGKMLPQPKGVLLTGFPGCGKSFAVQALAGSWGVNLIRLDPSRLFRSFVGETEQNFIAAFETVISLAPAVLWIDELEKFFSHSPEQSADGGVLSRVLALVLDFLESRRDGIFVCATTNAIAGLPQEIMRPGRFDAVFFIDLPNRKEREHILKILFSKYGLFGKLRVTEEVLGATKSFSGAELEQAITDFLYEQDEAAGRINEFALLGTIKRMVPLARTMTENFDLMREWYKTRARFASSLDDADQEGGRRICHISRK
jgi:ATPase family associated with various cellular activities (AAA)